MKNEEHVGAHGFGGTCTCPSGLTYNVGDIDGTAQKCGKLACKDGLHGACSEQIDEEYKGHSVTCGVIFLLKIN